MVDGDILELFADFHKGGLRVDRLNYQVITLLPKLGEANRIQQFQPICLLSWLYKLIRKTLLIRIEPYVDKLIDKTQVVFIKNRNTMNGVFALHEILHGTKR